MGVVREENQRLKMCLNKIMNEYRTLEMQFQDILKQQGTKKNVDKGKAFPSRAYLVLVLRFELDPNNG